MTGWWNDDDELLALLRDALAEQRDVPARFVEAGKATLRLALDRRRAGGARLRLGDRPVRVRRCDPRGPRRDPGADFAFRDATVHVQIGRGGLHGQVVPPRPGEVEVHVEGRPPRTAAVDEQGWFSFAPLPHTPFRLLWRISGGGTAMTDWLTL